MNHARHDRGSTTVEFALVLLYFLMFVFAIVDMTRMVFTWNAASEAALFGARYAVVCADSTVNTEAAVLQRMQGLMPGIEEINLTWVSTTEDGAVEERDICNASNCAGVNVEIVGLEFEWVTPLIGMVYPRYAMPPFRTYLPRESMRQDPNSSSLCS